MERSYKYTVTHTTHTHQARSQPSDNGGGVVFLSFWTFSGFENNND